MDMFRYAIQVQVGFISNKHNIVYILNVIFQQMIQDTFEPLNEEN